MLEEHAACGCAGLQDFDVIGACWGEPPQYDCSRIKTDLGLRFFGVPRMLLDMLARLEHLGVLAPR